MGGTVWILGAGFSKPLGGPLLTDLFSTTSFETIKLRFKQYPTLRGPDSEAALWLYHWGIGFPDKDYWKKKKRGIIGEIGMWRDAEDYLDTLDAAVGPGPTDALWKRLFRAVKGMHKEQKVHDLQKILLSARRLMVAECSSFLVNVKLKREKWQPHVDWARRVKADDTIITFNYDLVLERLAEDSQVSFKVLLPGNIPKSGFPPVLKLHGSVDWRRDKRNKKVCFLKEDTHYALTCPKTKLGIASPGPSKRIRVGELQSLWRMAEDAIKSAKAIVFVGYRFPPTDAEARKRLLMAIEDNTSPYLHLHTVLGIESPNDSTRMKHLLEWIGRKKDRVKLESEMPLMPSRLYYTLTQHQLYSEDFFTVYSEDIIENPLRR